MLQVPHLFAHVKCEIANASLGIEGWTCSSPTGPFRQISLVDNVVRVARDATTGAVYVVHATHDAARSRVAVFTPRYRRR